jgi:hypothetical protein
MKLRADGAGRKKEQRRRERERTREHRRSWCPVPQIRSIVRGEIRFFIFGIYGTGH